MFKYVLWGLIILAVCFLTSKIFFATKRLRKAKTRKEKRKAIFGIISCPALLLVIITVFSICSFAIHDRTSIENAKKEFAVNKDNYSCDFEVEESVIEDLQEKYWNKVPESVRENKKNWQVLFKDTMPESMQPSISVGKNKFNVSNMVCAGLTYNQKRLIYVNNAMPYDCFVNSYIHEFGHSISYEYGMLHGSYEWQKIYKENADKSGCGDYNKSNAAEFFAWSYAEYYLNPESLKAFIPDVYNYMNNLNQTELPNSFVEKVFVGYKVIFNQLMFYLFE